MINIACLGCFCCEYDVEELRDQTDPFADRIISFEFERFITENHRINERADQGGVIQQARIDLALN